MKIGDYTLYSIETSEFGLDGGAMFGIIPKPLWEKQSPADEKNRISMVTRSLLLVSNERKILIDTGNGTKWEEKFKNIYNINELRQRIGVTLFLLLVYRLGAQVVIPGIDSVQLATLAQKSDAGGLLGILNAFTGGAFANASVFALGIMPYISASIDRKSVV